MGARTFGDVVINGLDDAFATLRKLSAPFRPPEWKACMPDG
jgi:hypothetical protein